MLCLSRLAGQALYFGDGEAQYYTERCCSNVIDNLIDNKNTVCKDCIKKTSDSKQNSRKFNHSSVNNLIPPESHIFGPTQWFLEGCRLYGTPSKEALKKSVEAHYQAIMTITKNKKEDKKEVLEKQVLEKQVIQKSLKYIESPQKTTVDREETVLLKVVLKEKKFVYKDTVNNIYFVKNKDGTIGDII